uniref:Ymf67 n=1 Tax=Tetrahymena thermophila TaxID=5911 RepID=Q950Y7_TETTH|nr:ymf67 [Tetrahymena thermophila]7W5Z_Y7 Chain Y7, Ymf67 [Tetrahymena thermophila]7W5Z_y7 Chain y7, Ymf67 [Tetrahymena thermophila]8B6H_DN Chain DN, Ymf67 [Tetrahymena thermophila SB210]8B6H_Dn Chain Dn, Ymf67 [Tetrahymena thermophila SB210]8BQS_DN Chain DN, Ymf67 [Tetrahymena thermophila SB210]8BQS_Dn Chain Dn, Ymf67 [Tetrahymena thermophila SB210]8GYM_Y7 Chain Y7, Ymf67 [Tetrahymena thermophila SB210]8GYM_y7 Chain y7, Ymf67 [Tetrahymena thermophila SB210]8GZU_0E Chain 0E, Ymf67 [Tetrahy
MTALFLHILWSISYIIINILYIFLSLLLSNNNEKIKQYNSNYFIKILLVLFYNKNLSFYKNLLSEDEISKIEFERLKNYPTLVLIHSNLNKLEKRNKIINSFINFKTKYRFYKFISTNFNLQTIIKNCNDKIIFSTLLYIVNLNYSFFYKTIKNTDLIVYLLANKFSILNDNIIVSKFNISKFNDYIKYINNTNSIDTYLENQIILGLNNNTNSNITKNINTKLLNSYSNLKNLVNITNNTFYLKKINDNYNTVINSEFLTYLKSNYKISFSASNIVKYLSDKSVNNSVILYLRKNKIFNKSRYSRNRQTYRTGAYWCLYVNIIAVVAFYFWFYKFTMNFGYLWWLLYSLILSFFFSRALKHRFYNPLNVMTEFKNGFMWFIIILINIFKPLLKLLENNYINLYNHLVIKYYQSFICNTLINKKKLEFNYILSSFKFIKELNNIIIISLNKLF